MNERRRQLLLKLRDIPRYIAATIHSVNESLSRAWLVVILSLWGISMAAILALGQLYNSDLPPPVTFLVENRDLGELCPGDRIAYDQVLLPSITNNLIATRGFRRVTDQGGVAVADVDSRFFAVEADAPYIFPVDVPLPDADDTFGRRGWTPGEHYYLVVVSRWGVQQAATDRAFFTVSPTCPGLKPTPLAP